MDLNWVAAVPKFEFKPTTSAPNTSYTYTPGITTGQGMGISVNHNVGSVSQPAPAPPVAPEPQAQQQHQPEPIVNRQSSTSSNLSASGRVLPPVPSRTNIKPLKKPLSITTNNEAPAQAGKLPWEVSPPKQAPEPVQEPEPQETYPEEEQEDPETPIQEQPQLSSGLPWESNQTQGQTQNQPQNQQKLPWESNSPVKTQPQVNGYHSGYESTNFDDIAAPDDAEDDQFEDCQEIAPPAPANSQAKLPWETNAPTQNHAQPETTPWKPVSAVSAVVTQPQSSPSQKHRGQGSWPPPKPQTPTEELPPQLREDYQPKPINGSPKKDRKALDTSLAYTPQAEKDRKLAAVKSASIFNVVKKGTGEISEKERQIAEEEERKRQESLGRYSMYANFITDAENSSDSDPEDKIKKLERLDKIMEHRGGFKPAREATDVNPSDGYSRVPLAKKPDYSKSYLSPPPQHRQTKNNQANNSNSNKYEPVKFNPSAGPAFNKSSSAKIRALA